MNYAEMSDFEINRRVLAIKSGIKPLSYPHDADKRSSGIVDVNGNYHWFDFCNSWADAGPIIQKYRITLDADLDIWFARDENNVQTDESPLRAAMIVFLMMMKEPTK